MPAIEPSAGDCGVKNDDNERPDEGYVSEIEGVKPIDKGPGPGVALAPRTADMSPLALPILVTGSSPPTDTVKTLPTPPVPPELLRAAVLLLPIEPPIPLPPPLLRLATNCDRKAFDAGDGPIDGVE